MGCASCNSGSNGKPRGCRSNGFCATRGCEKLPVFDWLSNMQTDSLPSYPYVELRFKNGRKAFALAPSYLSLSRGSVVVVDAGFGYDMGSVDLRGELVRIQMKRKLKAAQEEEILRILRLPDQDELDLWTSLRDKEPMVQIKARELAHDLELSMKISDVEYQADGRKITFYYTAEKRVDFRDLVRILVAEFRTKIEMRQIRYRHEAARLGGIGDCGRELCCSTWLTDFRKVTTEVARYQQLSFKMDKLNGQCGKLKCCLNYELDSYTEALRYFPPPSTKLFTTKGVGDCQKIDIFTNVMWYSYHDDRVNWIPLSVKAVKKIIKMNQANKPVSKLEDYAL